MSKNADASPRKAAIDADFHVRLLINRMRRRQLGLALMILGVVMVALVATGYETHKPWWLTALPLTASGLLICLIPPSEAWEYKPWQARPRQYERHQIQR